MTASPVLKLREAMAYLQRGRSWMLAHADEIGAVRDGKRVVFYPADLDAWLARHRKQTPGLRVVAPPMKRQPKTTDRISPMTGRPYGVAR